MNIENVTLTTRDIMFLVSSINGSEVKRSATKATAVTAFEKALASRIGEAAAAEHSTSILLSPDSNIAHHQLGVLTMKVDGVEENVTHEPKEEMQMTATATAPATRGRAASNAGKKLTALVESNTRRANSNGFKSLQIILDNPGITYEEFTSKGGRSNDLQWDIAKGNVKAD